MAVTKKSIRKWLDLEVESMLDSIARGEVETAKYMASIAARAAFQLRPELREE